MPHTRTPSSSTPDPLLTRRLLLAGGTASAALTLLGCGGGGGGGSTVAGTSSGAGSFSSGPIQGFGSIIVNGVRFDDNAATVVHDAGEAGTSADLRLGMVVEVSGSDISADDAGQRRAAAATISMRSEITGPISAIDPAAGTLTVLGQLVRITPITVFEDGLSGGLAALAVGQVVEVYGLLNAQGQYTATRIERKDSASRFKLRGVVSGLNPTARTFRIGAVVISYAGLSVPGLADGQYVRVELLTTPGTGGVWTASRVDIFAAGSRVPSAGAGLRVELEGFITAFTSNTRFSVNGVPVDATGAASLPTGLALGRRVEVKGTLSTGVVLAREVKLEDDNGNDDGNGQGPGREFEIKGLITSVNVAAKTLVVRGVTVNWATATFRGVNAGPDRLVPGTLIEVSGRLASNGTTVTARVIEFKN